MSQPPPPPDPAAPDPAALAPDRAALVAAAAVPQRQGQAAGRKRGIPWHQDPTILARMELVRELNAQGFRTRQIAEILRAQGIRCDHTVVVEDLKRLRAILRERLGDALEDHRAEALDNYKRVLRQAWTSYASAKKGSRDAAEHLRVLVMAQMALDALLGLTAAEIHATAAAEANAGTLARWLAGMAAYEQAQRQRFLAAASDDDLTPRDRSTRELVEAAYREAGIARPAAAGAPSGATVAPPAPAPDEEELTW